MQAEMNSISNSTSCQNNLNKSKKDKILEYLYKLERKMFFRFKSSMSSLFFLTVLVLLLLLNSSFFHANETFYNNINPIFENYTIILDEIEKESPFYENYQSKIKESNSNLIDLFDGNLKIVHDTIELNQFTFIYM
jgi:hypothetical protein